MKIYFIENIEDLKKFLKEYSEVSEGKRVFLSWQYIDKDAKALLDEEGFERVNILEFDSEYKSRFIKEYTGLIDSMGKNCKNGRLWWATDTASKNRFASKISEDLQQFVEIVETIKKEEISEFVIVGLNKAVMSSIKKAIGVKNVDMLCFGYGLKDFIFKSFFILKKFVGVLFNALLIYSRAVLCRLTLRKKILEGQNKYIVKTFIYDHSFLNDGSYKDTFFGKLIPYLKEKEDVLIFANILGNFKYCINKIKANKDSSIFPIEFFIKFVDILSAVKEILFARINIDIECKFLGYDVSSILKRSVHPIVFNVQVFQHLHYAATRNMLKSIVAKTFLLTYENNPWERMCIKAVREADKKITVLGFQHTVVPQASLNMFVGKNAEFIPDKILTVGEIPKLVLEKYGNYKQDQVDTACALRHQYLFDIKQEERTRNRRILLALEGVKEVHKMVDYAINQLAENDKYDVRIRTHPVLAWKYFEKQHKYNINGIDNFEISTSSSLIDDIKWSDIVMYWGSTVVIEALSIGKPAIHFDNGAILSYDPLFENDCLKWTVSRVDSLENRLDQINSLDDQQFIVEQNKAKKYIDRYFYPIVEESLEKFLYKK
ncbi:MAG: hypothetical protein P9X22_03675 [Candidatus Zapsychrus exili]|nr:hypothetical protein [Candidatus Zapsychrus exili]